MMDFDRAEKLLSHLVEAVDLPLCDQSLKVSLSHTLACTSLHFAASVRILCGENLILGSASLLRSQFEALVRSVWALHRATEGQIEKLSSDLSLDSQQATKNFPSVNEMMVELEKFPPLQNLLVKLKEFKESSWLPLNSFVHSGVHAIQWTKYEPPPHLLDQTFRASNGLAVLAFMNIAMLTGRPELQREIIAISAPFSSCLPAYRKVCE